MRWHSRGSAGSRAGLALLLALLQPVGRPQGIMRPKDAVGGAARRKLQLPLVPGHLQQTAIRGCVGEGLGEYGLSVHLGESWLWLRLSV